MLWCNFIEITQMNFCLGDRKIYKCLVTDKFNNKNCLFTFNIHVGTTVLLCLYLKSQIINFLQQVSMLNMFD